MPSFINWLKNNNLTYDKSISQNEKVRNICKSYLIKNFAYWHPKKISLMLKIKSRWEAWKIYRNIKRPVEYIKQQIKKL